MKLRSPVFPAVVLLASSLSATFLSAQQSDSGTAVSNDEKLLRVFATAAKLRATVVDMNRAEGLLLLRGQDGDEQMVKAGSAVRNLDQIAVGDQVSADLREATAISVRRHEPAAGAPAATVTRAKAVTPTKIELAPLRDSPGAAVTDVSEVIAAITDIDYAKRQVTLLGPGGWPRIINVSDNVHNLDDLSKGDLIVIRYTEPLAIGITR